MPLQAVADACMPTPGSHQGLRCAIQSRCMCHVGCPQVADGAAEAAYIVRQLRRWRAQGLRLGDVAVLYRTNSQARPCWCGNPVVPYALAVGPPLSTPFALLRRQGFNCPWGHTWETDRQTDRKT